MKARLFTVSVLVASIVLLALLVPIRSRPFVARAQPDDLASTVLGNVEEPALDHVPATAALQSAPLMFIENIGQFDESVRFQVRGSNATIYLADDALWLTVLEKPSSPQLLSPDLQEGVVPLPTPEPAREVRDEGQPRRGVNLKYSFVGANPDLRLEPFNRLDTVVSYFTGNDPAKWRPNVPVWGGVRYCDLYPGVDLEMTGENGQWMWRLVTRDGADLDKVRLRVEGADDMTADSSSGRLRMETPVGDVNGPIVTTAQPKVLMHADIEGNTVRFAPSSQPGSESNASSIESANSDGNSDALVYSTFLGGSNFDAGNAIAAGSDGTAYVTGETYSTDFPTISGAFDTTSNGDRDIFVTKLQSAGNALAFSTFLGGSSSDLGYAIALDATGAVYLVGSSYSSNFPITAEALDTTHNGNWDVVVVKLNASGTALLYSTYLGGSSRDSGDDLAIDTAGEAYITGETVSSNFPTTPDAFDTTWNGGSPYGDAFVTKLNSAGSALEYSTFLGSTDEDDANGITVDASGAAYVTGRTLSSNFPTTTRAFNTTFGGHEDVFITKLNASGSDLIYSGLLSGSKTEQGQGIAVDILGSVYVAGQTNSSDFMVTPGAYDASLSGEWDGFVAEVSPSGDTLVYSTYLGGSDWDCETVGVDRECVIAADNSGVVYIAGRTFSADFPTTTEGFDTSYNGNEDGFMAKLSPDGGSLVYGSFFGGTSADQTLAVAVDAAGGASASGRTYSSDFPTTVGAFDQTYNGGVDAFVVRLPVGSGLPPSPQGNLQLHMPDALPLDTPIVPVVTVVNVDPVPADYTVVVQLWRGFGMLAEQSQDVSFVSFGRQQITFDFGVYDPASYSIWAELWQGDEELEVEWHSFSVGLDYLRLQAAAADLTNAAYDEMNESENIAVDALAKAAVSVENEAIGFLLNELASRVVQLGNVDEIDADVAAGTGIEIVDWAMHFSTAIDRGTYNGAATFWRNLLSSRTFNDRRSSVDDAEMTLLEFARTQTFAWDPTWQDRVVRYETAIQNKNEAERVGLGISLSFEPPFLHRATLQEMKGQFDWVNDVLWPELDKWSTFLLIGLACLLVIALVLIKLPAVLAALIVTAGKAVLYFYPILLKLFWAITNVKLIAGMLILLLFAMFVAGTAEQYVSPTVVTEHQDAMDYLRNGISGQMSVGPLPTISLSTETRGHYADFSAQLDSEGSRAWLETQLFRGDGQLVEILDYGMVDAGVEMAGSWHLPVGTYWTVAVAHGRDDIQTQRSAFQVTSAAVTLDLTLSEDQISLGEPLEATITLTNQDPITGTGALVLSAMALDGEGLQVWLPELGPGESVVYDYAFIPQAEGGYVLRATVSDDLGAVARVDRAFLVGDAPAVAMNLSPQANYPPSQDVVWTVTAINIGTQPTTTLLAVNTYDRNAGYNLVFSTTYTLTAEAGASTTFTLTALPASLPGAYSTHLLLGDCRYRTVDFLVEADGALFAIARAEPLAVSISEALTLTVEVQDETYAATDASVTVSVHTPAGEILDIPCTQTDTGRYQATYVPHASGTYGVEVIASKPNYASAVESTFFTSNGASLLLVDTQGQLVLNATTPVTLSVGNEHFQPVPNATVIVSGTNGLVTGQTDEAGIVDLVLKPVNTGPVKVRVQKPGFASTYLRLPVAIVSDTVAPALSMILPETTSQAALTFHGVTEPDVTLLINDEEIPVASDGVFTATVNLVEGANLITGVATDSADNNTTVLRTVTLDTVVPMLMLTWPPEGLFTTRTTITVTGVTDPDAALLINDLLVDPQQDGSFSSWVLVDRPGANAITVVAVDRAGNETVAERMIRRPSVLYLPLILRNH